MKYLVAPERLDAQDFVLRSYRPGDGRALSEAITSSYEHLAPWMPWAKQEQGVEESEMLARTFRARWLLAEDFVIGVFAPDDATLLGGCGFHLREGPLASLCAEMGMWIRASHAGHGLGTGVLRTLIAWGFDEWPWQRLSWRCDVANVGSFRVAEKAGMLREGVLRNQIKESLDGRRDTACYAAQRSAWVDPGD